MSILVRSSGMPTELVRSGMMDYESTSTPGSPEVFGRSSNRPREASGYPFPLGKPDSVNNGSSFLSCRFGRVVVSLEICSVSGDRPDKDRPRLRQALRIREAYGRTPIPGLLGPMLLVTSGKCLYSIRIWSMRSNQRTLRVPVRPAENVAKKKVLTRIA